MKQSQLIIILLIALIPFASTNLTYDPTLIKTTFIKIGILIILAGYLINLLRDREIRIRKIPPIFLIALLAGYSVINFILKYPLASAEGIFSLSLFFLFFFTLSHLSSTPFFTEFVIWEIFLVTSLIGFSSIIAYFTSFHRVRLFFYNPNFLASYFVFTIPLGLSLIHERYKTNSPRLLWTPLRRGQASQPMQHQSIGITLLLYFLLLIQIGGFIATFSRAGSLGFSASILFLIFLRSSKIIWKRISIFCMIAIIFSSIFLMSAPSIFVNQLGVRAYIWQGTYRMIKENLLIGSGIGSFSRVYPSFRPPQYFLLPEAAPITLHSHNEFLETWAELGIIGLLLWLGFLLSLFYYVLKRADRTDMPNYLLIQGLLAGSLGLCIQNIFSVSLRIPFIAFYLWLGLGMSTGALKEPCFLKISLGDRTKRAILFLLFLAFMLWTSVRHILFPFLGDLYFQKGWLERAKGNFTRAIDYYSIALNFSPEPRDIYYSRAFILNKIGREKDALKDYLKIEEISPGYAKVYLNIGITYLSLGYLNDAIEKLEEAVSLNPYDSHSRNSLGVAYAKKGLPEKAREEFEQALLLNPRLKEASLNLMKLGNDYIP